LIAFLYNLTQVDRFSMAIDFLDDSEKDDINSLLTSLENSLTLLIENEDFEEDEGQQLEDKLSKTLKVFE